MKSLLLDIMVDLMREDFISDLQAVNRERYEKLLLRLRDIPTEKITLRDWNAAINYLSQGSPV